LTTSCSTEQGGGDERKKSVKGSGQSAGEQNEVKTSRKNQEAQVRLGEKRLKQGETESPNTKIFALSRRKRQKRLSGKRKKSPRKFPGFSKIVLS